MRVCVFEFCLSSKILPIIARRLKGVYMCEGVVCMYVCMYVCMCV